MSTWRKRFDDQVRQEIVVWTTIDVGADEIPRSTVRLFLRPEEEKSPYGPYLLPLFHSLAAVRSFTTSSGASRGLLSSHAGPSITCFFWSRALPLSPCSSFWHCLSDATPSRRLEAVRELWFSTKYFPAIVPS